MSIEKICVFCGSSFGGNPEYIRAARALGQTLVERRICLVYGGGKVGLMGEIARAVAVQGGKVIGVMPRYLVEKEVALHEIDLRVVDTMHERKALMAELADGFVALPGGLGTLDEIAEILNWGQLNLHQKPCGLLNVGGYFDPLLHFLDHMVAEHFLHAEHRAMLLSSEDPGRLLDRFLSYQAPKADKAAWTLKNSLKPLSG
jgi:uncharacterized protein (TIGR00730 family)